jgi:hypothetical protein
VLWADCDDRDAIAALEGFSPQPAIVVRTSSRGLHAYQAPQRRVFGRLSLGERHGVNAWVNTLVSLGRCLPHRG